MNYSQAKATAKKLVHERKIDHVISFDGVSYSVHMKPKYKGNITETVKYKYVKPTIKDEPKEPVKKAIKKSDSQ